MRLTRHITAALLLCALALPLAADAGPRRDLLTSNVTQGGPPSLDSGLVSPAPCTGGGVALRPIWAKAAQEFGLRWQILAAITKVESDMGCNMGPSSAGAVGWTQFIPDTWRRWGMDADGDRKADPRNAVDAIYSTARYLRVTGAPGSYRRAIFAYNHADWYVEKVLDVAETFGEFSDDEFDELSGFAREGAELRAELERLRARIRAVPARRDKLQRRLEAGERRLSEGKRELERRERAFGRARAHLNRVTLDYISYGQGIAQGPDRSQDDDVQVLEYLAASDPQDAVLVYQSANTLMDHQGDMMAELRSSALAADRERAQVEELTAAREQLVAQRRDDLAELDGLDERLRGDLRSVRKRMRAYERVERRYVGLYGGGTLSESPFVGSLEGRSTQERIVLLARAELERGVSEQPPGSNNSPDIARYRTATAGSPGAGPWCAYFVSYITARAGAPLMEGGRGHGAVVAIRAWANRSGRYTRTPKPGYLIDFSGHIGIVEKVSPDGEVTTIEGNTSNMVARRYGREAKALGYIRTG